MSLAHVDARDLRDALHALILIDSSIVLDLLRSRGSLKSDFGKVSLAREKSQLTTTFNFCPILLLTYVEKPGAEESSDALDDDVEDGLDEADLAPHEQTGSHGGVDVAACGGRDYISVSQISIKHAKCV